MAEFDRQNLLWKRLKRSWPKRLLFPEPDDLNLWRWICDELNYRASLNKHDGYEQLLQAWPPLVIGGTGGSGTRVFVSICEQARYYVGANLNRANDSLDTVSWIRKWLPQAIMLMHDSGTPIPPRMNQEFNLMLMRHRRRIPSLSHPWVIKNPRLMLALPYLHSRLPGVKFIHVLRDGRDVAFSRNQQQHNRYGNLSLDDEIAGVDLPVSSIAFWARTNLAVADYGQTMMTNSYLRVRFEDLCQRPREVTADILAFLNCDADVDKAAACVVSPKSIGRWRDSDPNVREQVIHYGSEALDYFGYTNE